MYITYITYIVEIPNYNYQFIGLPRELLITNLQYYIIIEFYSF